MKLEILREAEDELIEAVEYYEVREAGLGVRSFLFIKLDTMMCVACM